MHVSDGQTKLSNNKMFIVNNKTTGAPIAITINNRDWENWKDKEIEPYLVPRPGHADLAGTVKYDHPDIRHVLERASARETAMRTALGSICLLILQDLGIEIFGYVQSIGSKQCNELDFSDLSKLKSNQAKSSSMCPDEASDTEFENAILAAGPWRAKRALAASWANFSVF